MTGSTVGLLLASRAQQLYCLAMNPIRTVGPALLIAGLPLSPQTSKMERAATLRVTPSTTAGGAATGHWFQADRGSRKGQYLHVAAGSAKESGAPGPTTSDYQLVGAKSAGALP